MQGGLLLAGGVAVAAAAAALALAVHGLTWGIRRLSWQLAAALGGVSAALVSGLLLWLAMDPHFDLAVYAARGLVLFWLGAALLGSWQARAARAPVWAAALAMFIEVVLAGLLGALAAWLRDWAIVRWDPGFGDGFHQLYGAFLLVLSAALLLLAVGRPLREQRSP